MLADMSHDESSYPSDYKAPLPQQSYQPAVHQQPYAPPEEEDEDEEDDDDEEEETDSEEEDDDGGFKKRPPEEEFGKVDREGRWGTQIVEIGN